MKMLIERIRYTELRNNEFIQVIIFIIDICKKYDNEKLHLEKAYEELVAFRLLLKAVTVSERKNKKISDMRNLDIERNTLIKSINKTIEGLERVCLPEINKHSKILTTFLEKYKLKKIFLASRTEESERLRIMEADYNTSTDIQIAFQAFGLQPVINRLFAANREYNDLFSEYISEKSNKKRIDIVSLRKNCTKALIQYLNAIQYCAFAHKENDYQPLINVLKQFNAY
jgi:hypothetical protein